MLELPELLSALTEELMQIRDGSRSAFAISNGQHALTADEEFIYLEAELASRSSTEIDIAIHEKRAFVRIERCVTDSDSFEEAWPGSSAIFGWVEVAQEGVTIRALLTRDGLWSCTVAPEIADMLNTEYSAAGDPSDHASVCDALIRAAERLQGLAWLDPDRLLDE